VKRFFSFCVTAMIAAADTGTPTRPTAAQYDVHQEIADATIAATLLTPARTSTIFSTDVRKNFMVVEIAVYPGNGHTLDLSMVDFTLRTGPDSTDLAVTPENVAWHGKRMPGPSQSSRTVNVIGEAGIAVGTRTNPVTGRTDHGVATYGAVGVDTRPQAVSTNPNSAADNIYRLETKLRALELQEGQVTHPISGYLYFPVSKKRNNVSPVLEYSRNGERTALSLPVH
jgi:hypothetical protein